MGIIGPKAKAILMMKAWERSSDAEELFADAWYEAVTTQRIEILRHYGIDRTAHAPDIDDIDAYDLIRYMKENC